MGAGSRETLPEPRRDFRSPHRRSHGGTGVTGDLWAPASEDIRGKLLESVRGRLYLGVLDLQVGCGRRQELQRGHEGGGVGLHLAGHGDLTGSHGQPRVGVRGALSGRGALAVYRAGVKRGALLIGRAAHEDVPPWPTFAYGPACAARPHGQVRRAPGGLDGRCTASRAGPGLERAALRA